MKRDMDLFRLLLLKIESSETGFTDDLDIPCYSRQEIDSHVKLLLSAGLIDHKSDPTDYTRGAFDPAVNRLTWEGHEFIAAIRSDSVWDRTKEFLKDSGLDVGSLPIELLKSVAVARIKDMLT